MKERLQAIRNACFEKLEQAQTMDVLNEIRVEFLGKKGALTEVLKSMKDVAPEDRPAVGALVNEARAAIENRLEEV